jgi:mono/diheme cytochrome c family protein
LIAVVRRLLVAIGALAVLALLVAAPLVLRLREHGISARDEPTAVEAAVARSLRSWAIPARLRDARNPIEPSADALGRARAHFADHCASCHGNDGRGKTKLGQGLYPKAPDMTLPATQSLSDGELFAIIENGVRFTGMPGWGEPGPEDDPETWELVHFIRRLQHLTPASCRYGIGTRRAGRTSKRKTRSGSSWPARTPSPRLAPRRTITDEEALHAEGIWRDGRGGAGGGERAGVRARGP